MFTSRAEYRLLLRADNADLRLTPKGLEIGCIGRKRGESFRAKERALAEARKRVATLSLTPSAARKHGLAVNLDGVARSAADLLGSTGIDLERLSLIWPELAGLRADVAGQIEIEAHYAGYLTRQAADIEAFRRDEALELPGGLDYGAIGGLSGEAREKLARARPATLGAASRIPGVTPAALTALLRHVRRRPARPAA
jgi:tRNA uridine 5-carboxymethylaminomethyl modification enzyme